MDSAKRETQIYKYFCLAPTLDEVARILILEYLSKYRPIRSAIYYLDGKDGLSRLASYGSTLQESDVISDSERGFSISGQRWRNILVERQLSILEASPEDSVSWTGDRRKAVVGLYMKESLIGALVIEFAAPIKVTPEMNRTLGIYSRPISVYIVLRLLDDLRKRESAPGPISHSNMSQIMVDKSLSARQRLILSELMQKKTNHSIADDLGYSVSTIRQEVSRLFQIMNVSNREEAAAHGRDYLALEDFQRTKSYVGHS